MDKAVFTGKGTKHDNKTIVWRDAVSKGFGATTSDHSAFLDANVDTGCKMTAIPEFLVRPSLGLGLQNGFPWKPLFDKQ